MDFIEIIARFFANEFFCSIVPSDRKIGLDEFILEYRDKINYYMDNFTVLLSEENKFYEKVLDKLFNYAESGKLNYSRADILPFTKLLCPENVWNTFNVSKKQALFRRFLTNAVKKFQIYTIAKSAEYSDAVLKSLLETHKQKIVGMQNTAIQTFIAFLKKQQHEIHAKCMLINQGRGSEEINSITVENKVIDELREIIEQLQFSNKRLTDENKRLRDENLKLLMVERQEEPEQEYSDEEEETIDIKETIDNKDSDQLTF